MKEYSCESITLSALFSEKREGELTSLVATHALHKSGTYNALSSIVLYALFGSFSYSKNLDTLIYNFVEPSGCIAQCVRAEVISRNEGTDCEDPKIFSEKLDILLPAFEML
jgi:hypothetical protein